MCFFRDTKKDFVRPLVGPSIGRSVCNARVENVKTDISAPAPGLRRYQTIKTSRFHIWGWD